MGTASNSPNLSDEEFLRRFEDHSLPLKSWNHRAHLKVAYLYLLESTVEEALPKLRHGIRSYNSAHAITDSPASGYHETMTQAWLRLVHLTLSQFGPAESADAFFEAQTQLTQKRILLLFYSRDLIMAPEAKSSFVAPDLTALPRLPVHNPLSS